MLTVIAVGVGFATVWSWHHLGMSVTAVVDGIGDVRNLLERMLPPRFVDLPRIVDLAVQTFFMAYVGTWIASLLSAPLAFLAARNTSPHPVLGKTARALIAVCRAIPDLVFALVFVRAVGIGPLPGILALSLHSVGMIGKLYADAIEQIDELPREATLSTGASSLQALATAVFPQVLPSFVGTSLYRLDINVRSSVVLGLVGAGGIGFEL
ncbi:MAG: phosphonate ABC transporter, permease protein PhnE, partial [Acidimicrobiales bacterium]